MTADEQPSGSPAKPLPKSVSGQPVIIKSTENEDSAPTTNTEPTISAAFASIKKEDFANVANMPCARNGFMTGIVTGVATGALKLFTRGNWSKAANWAVGMFVVGSTASYEYCQFQRRKEKRNMRRAVEIHAENQKVQEKRLARQKEQEKKMEEQRKAAEKRWYKFW
ncbi:hypothetical protein NQ176_g3634 [Zarea fungicola]|uniref:Uncharacterized protein n=1 Tax=Zarea fungicola TaxID=93591 RepID=A0ACC1NHF9_9HYPO|nr:hypothetical protein NQ176_g3634 [Lecanicillium fungicola]